MWGKVVEGIKRVAKELGAYEYIVDRWIKYIDYLLFNKNHSLIKV